MILGCWKRRLQSSCYFSDMELDDRPSLGVGHLASFKNRASFFLKDGLKIARLALVDVSPAEL